MMCSGASLGCGDSFVPALVVVLVDGVRAALWLLVSENVLRPNSVKLITIRQSSTSVFLFFIKIVLSLKIEVQAPFQLGVDVPSARAGSEDLATSRFKGL